jgi:hypothetical protein
VTLWERERVHGRKERVTDAAAQLVWEKRKGEKDGPTCVRKHTIRVTRFLAPDWLRQ